MVSHMESSSKKRKKHSLKRSRKVKESKRLGETLEETVTEKSFCFNFFGSQEEDGGVEDQISVEEDQDALLKELKEDPITQDEELVEGKEEHRSLFFFHPDDPNLSNRLYDDDWNFHRQCDKISDLFKDWPEKRRRVKNICNKQRKEALRQLKRKQT